MNPGPDSALRRSGDGWIVAVHRSRHDHEPVGTGFLIDGSSILTCAHVVCDRGVPRDGLWVAFPKSETLMGRRVQVDSVRVPPREAQAADDVAVLRLAEDVGVQFAARLRCPEPEQLTGRDWWSFGFSHQDMFGNPSSGTVGTVRGYGWIQLDVQAEPGDMLAEGYSGAPLWSDAYQAVVGIIGQADARTSGRALSLWRARTALPEAGIAALAEWSAEAAGESALAAWGWSLADDPEAGRHWRPRARGVARDSEPGFRFRGRRSALEKLAGWIVDEQPQRTALVVTGSPGVGKSAVLGRIVTSADESIAAQLPPEDDAVRAVPGSVACAVHAKSKSALDVAAEIARAASAPLPQQTADLALGLRAAFAERPGRKFAVVIDALDEAASPKDAREIVRWIVRPLVEDLADLGVRVVVGSRRRDNGGDLLGAFKPAITLIDLDDTDYFELEDLEAYALVSLQLLGAGRDGNPYADARVGAPIAKRIAALSDKNFLVAGLMARAHGLYDTVPVRPEEISFSPKVDDALSEFLERIPPVGQRTAAELLTALAYAEAPGFTAGLWHVAATALYGEAPGEEQLRTFARASAANFLVEDTAGEGAAEHGRVYRLFHQALNDVLLAARDQHVADEGALTRAFAEHGRQRGWASAPTYLLRSLAGHAERGDAMDALLAEDAYPLYADLRRLITTALRSYGSREQQPERLRLLRKTLRTVDEPPGVRAAYFSLVEAQEHLGAVYRDLALRSPYRTSWAYTQPQKEQTILEGHDGPVHALATLPTEQKGRYLLASCGQDGTVRLWDPDLGGNIRVIHANQGALSALCSVPWHGGAALLASGSEDGTVQLWNPDTGENVRTLRQRPARVESLTYVEGRGKRQMLAVLYARQSLQVYDLLTGGTVCQFPADDRIGEPVAVYGDGKSRSDKVFVCVRKGPFGSVYEWPVYEDTAIGDLQQIAGHVSFPLETVPQMLTVTFGRDRHAVIVGDQDGSLTAWETGRYVPLTKQHRDTPVTSICAVPMPDGRNLFAVAWGERRLEVRDLQDYERVWNPWPLHSITAFTGRANASTAVTVEDGNTLIATAGDDSTIRLWQPLPDSEESRADVDYGRHCALFPTGNGSAARLYSVTRDGDLHAWLQETGEHLYRWRLSPKQTAVCSVIPRRGGDSLLAIQDLVGTLTVADLESGRLVWTEDSESRMDRLHEPVVCMHALVGGPSSPWLLTAGDNGKLRVWDAYTGARMQPPKETRSPIGAICSVVGAQGETFAAAGCEDEEVRVWHMEDEEPLWRLKGHNGPVTSVFAASVPGDTPLLGSISGESQLRVWDLETGKLRFSLERPDRWAALACLMSGDFERTMLATAGLDRVVRIWDLNGHLIMEIPVRHELESMTSARNRLFLGLADGIMAVDVNVP